MDYPTDNNWLEKAEEQETSEENLNNYIVESEDHTSINSLSNDNGKSSVERDKINSPKRKELWEDEMSKGKLDDMNGIQAVVSKLEDILEDQDSLRGLVNGLITDAVRNLTKADVGPLLQRQLKGAEDNGLDKALDMMESECQKKLSIVRKLRKVLVDKRKNRGRHTRHLDELEKGVVRD